MNHDEGQPVKARLGMWDAVAIIVGIVIGTSIFKLPQVIMGNVANPWEGLGAWALGGLLSFIGALCYAELASTYPRAGGDYYFLSRAYGSWMGFLFGWAQLVVILTSSCGMMAFVFGEYTLKVWSPPGTVVSAEQTELLKKLPPGSAEHTELQETIRQANQRRDFWIAMLAGAAVLALTGMNVLGVVLGKLVQNLLSLVKVLGLIAIAVIGLKYGEFNPIAPPAVEVPAEKIDWGLAMILVLYAYGGWNDAAFVAAEMRNRRSIVTALLLGTTAITLIYLTVNVAYLSSLGFEGLRNSWTVAANAVQPYLGEDASRAISVLVMVSALGAVNGLIFTGSRVYSSLGTDHSVFAALGRWSPTFGSPILALLAHAVICLLMIVGVGTEIGRDAIDWAMLKAGLSKMPWDRYFGGFDTLLAGTAPVFWGFFLLSGLALFTLRQRDQDIERPFTVPLFPLVPLLFCGTCFFMLYRSISWAQWTSLLGAIPLAIGLPLYWISRERPGVNED